MMMMEITINLNKSRMIIMEMWPRKDLLSRAQPDSQNMIRFNTDRNQPDRLLITTKSNSSQNKEIRKLQVHTSKEEMIRELEAGKYQGYTNLDNIVLKMR